jgi:hypothetical protein
MLTDGNAVLGHDELFAPGEVMPGLDAAGLAPLLEQFLDHAVGDSKAPGDLFLGAFTPVAGADDALTEIKGKCGHS